MILDVPVEWTPEVGTQPSKAKEEGSLRGEPAQTSPERENLFFPQMMNVDATQLRHWGINE